MGGLQKALGIGALTLALYVGFGGCPKPLGSGTLLNKIHQPERTYTEDSILSLGRHGPATIKITWVDDEDFILILGKEEAGYRSKFETRAIYVSEDTYNSLQEGDILDTSKVPHWDLDENKTVYPTQ